MSSIWSAIDIAGSGVNVDQTWIDTIGGNIANMNDAVTPGKSVYRAQYVDASEVLQGSGTNTEGDGVQVAAVTLGPSTGTLAYQPNDPIANAQGEVELPTVDLATQLTSLVQAQTSYQANAEVMTNAKNAYQAILNIKA